MFTFFANDMEWVMRQLGLSLLANSVTWIFSIVIWALGCVALYSMAKRRGINHAWLSWIPVANVWILGSLADQYQYVSRGAVKNKRKALLILNLIIAVLTVLIIVLSVSTIVKVAVSAGGYYSEEEMFEAIFTPLMGMIFSVLPLAGVGIALAIIRYMALYDVYRSCTPDNAVLFLILSIFFGVTVPFFLFFNRKSDVGMVRQAQPSYQAPDYVNQPPQGDPWNQNNQQ